MKVCTTYCIILATCSILVLRPQRIHANVRFDLINGVSDVCKIMKEGIYPHSNFCHLYFNCSSDGQFQKMMPHLQECEYPKLFDVQSMSCEPFDKVSCGKREEIADACGYLANACYLSSHCIPCEVMWPNCGNVTGLIHYEQKRFTPYYGICSEGRVIDRKMCDKGIFHPDDKKCVLQEV